MMKHSLSSLLPAFTPYWQTAEYPAGGANGLPGTEMTLPLKSILPEPPTHAPDINLPHEVALVLIVISKAASMLPWNSAYVPIVAELPTCHQTLEALAPLTRRIRVRVAGGAAPAARVSVLPAWKKNSALGLPWASSVRSSCIPIAAAAV